ncbi:helix-turn-helix domain-containing protein, partial [Sphingomonas bacterium]|uniref:helix-turn-helix domain-containing protein n=1 Tax=Sphingomonas bacterium TaxID=1895847 RepID=UPI00266ED81E
AAAAPDPHDEVVAACEAGPSDFRSRVARFERELLARSLAEHRFNQRACAQALGLSYDQLRHALRRHGLIGG